MAIKLTEKLDGKILEVSVSGKLTDQDYQMFVPEFDRLAKQHGKIRVLFEMCQFHGWEAKAAWDDLKLGVKYYRDIERLAMVGENKWQQWMAAFCRPFTTAEIRYFDHSALAEARAWIEGDPATSTSSTSTCGLKHEKRGSTAYEEHKRQNQT
jgi:SpoIIAA-like